MKSISLFILPILLFSFRQAVKVRHYKEGAIFRYRLTTEVYHNDKFAIKTKSVSRHTVVKDSGFLSEEVK